MTHDNDEQWTTFLRDLDDSPGTVNLNHEWLEKGPESGRRTLVRVTIAMQSSRGQGMPERAEFEALGTLEDGLVEQVEKGGDAVFVATLMHHDERTAYFYTKRASASVAAAEKVVAGWKSHKAEVSTLEDADGEIFIETVCPTAAEIRWNGDMMVIRQLEEGGDDLKTPRPINHFAYFEDPESAESFAEWARENEFDVEPTEEGDTGDYLVAFSHNGPPDIEDIFDRTSAADETASEFGGMYDGWETEVVRAK